MIRIAAWILGGLAVVGLLGWAIMADNDADKKWRAWCSSQGGHVISNSQTSVVTTVGAGGKVGVGTSTTTTEYCLNTSGGIIDVRSS